MSMFSDAARYSQQIKLTQIGLDGQDRLRQARVLCVGAGGLGSPLLMYLAGAGIGHLGIVDDDDLEESNLHRQVLYHQQHVHQNKALLAKAQLEALNPLINIQAYPLRLNRENAESLISEYDVIADCSDNFYTRYLLHELCFRLGKPYVYATAYQFLGHCSVFYGKQTACLCCVFPTIPQGLARCQDGGVLGVVPGMLGVIQATEILKWLLGIGTTLIGRLLIVDVLAMKFQDIQLVKQLDCSLCVHGQAIEEIASSHCVLSSGKAQACNRCVHAL